MQMRWCGLFRGWIMAAAPLLAQQPSVTQIQNNYSYTAPGSTNYGISPGSLFIIQGSNLANGSTDLQSSAAPGLPTTLGGVTVTVSVNGTSKQATLYYILPTQIAAILPSTTPAGDGTVTVANNGQTSNAARIHVVQTAFGIDTLNGGATGRAVAQDAGGNLITDTNAANPGQTIILWGSGAGPDNANDDKTFPQKQNNLTSLPLQVDIGGVPAAILYRGRSQYPGVDQLDVTIPASVQPGCYVSVVASAGTSISNFATIPIAASGRNCSDSITGLGLGFTENINGDGLPLDVSFGGAELQSLNSGGPANVANIVLEQDNIPPGAPSPFGIPIPATTTVAVATFYRFTAAQLGAGITPYLLSIGSCTVVPSPFYKTMALNAGSAVNIAGPAGTSSLTPSPGGRYSNGLVNSFFPASGGTFNFDNGAGGADIGGFTTSASFPGPPLVWNEQNSTKSVGRSQPFTVTWSGGVPGTAVVISGLAGASTPQGGPKYFICLAPVAAQKFTIPATVLQSLPATVTSPITSSAYLGISNSSNPIAFSGPGIDIGLASVLVFDSTGANNGFTYR